MAVDKLSELAGQAKAGAASRNLRRHAEEFGYPCRQRLHSDAVTRAIGSITPTP